LEDAEEKSEHEITKLSKEYARLEEIASEKADEIL